MPLTPRQREYYTHKFLPVLHKDLIKVVVNRDDVVVGFLITMPSLSRALQRARGRLLPWGFWHLLRAISLKNNDTFDFCLVGVKKAYRGRGIDLIMAVDILKSAAQLGFRWAESNPELETNMAVRAEWEHLVHVQHKRRRIYSKPLV